MPDRDPDIWPPFVTALPLGLNPLESPTENGARAHFQPSMLLVDDDLFVLGMQSLMLRSMGYTMVGTADSAAATRRQLS